MTQLNFCYDGCKIRIHLIKHTQKHPVDHPIFNDG